MTDVATMQQQFVRTKQVHDVFSRRHDIVALQRCAARRGAILPPRERSRVARPVFLATSHAQGGEQGGEQFGIVLLST